MLTRKDMIIFADPTKGIARSVASTRGAQTRRSKQWQTVIEETKAAERAIRKSNVGAVCDEMMLTLHDATQTKIELAAERLISGRFDAEAFKKDVRKTLRTAYDKAAQIGKSKAKGEWVKLSDKDVRAVDRERYDEHKFLDGFVKDIQGKYKDLPPEKFAERIRWRSNMYVNAVGGEMNDSWLAHIPKQSRVKWVIGLHEHCQDCLDEGAMPPRLPSELTRTPRSGGTACLTNCGCHLVAVTERKIQVVTKSGVQTRTLKDTQTGAPPLSEMQLRSEGEE